MDTLSCDLFEFMSHMSMIPLFFDMKDDGK